MSGSSPTADGAPVVQVLEDLERLRDDGMPAISLDVGDETDAAGIVFKTRVIQAARRGGADFFGWGAGEVAQDGLRQWLTRQ